MLLKQVITIKQTDMRKISLCFALLLVVAVTHAQTGTSKNVMRQLIKENFALADTQYRYMMTLTPADKLPQSYEVKDNKFISRDIGWWCSGFCLHHEVHPLWTSPTPGTAE